MGHEIIGTVERAMSHEITIDRERAMEWEITHAAERAKISELTSGQERAKNNRDHQEARASFIAGNRNMRNPRDHTEISEAMLAAFADIKVGPLQRLDRCYVGPSGKRHHTNTVRGLVGRHLARFMYRPGQVHVTVTQLGTRLQPEKRSAQ